MKTLIVYYSRTGTTAGLAKTLAARLDADLCEIRCPRYGPGWLSYLRAGYDSLKGRLPPIDVPQVAAADYDLLLLGAPIWTSFLAVPLRAFLAQDRKLPVRVGVFLTHGAHSPPEKAADLVADLLPVPLTATLALRQEEVTQGHYARKIDAFVTALGASAARAG